MYKVLAPSHINSYGLMEALDTFMCPWLVKCYKVCAVSTTLTLNQSQTHNSLYVVRGNVTLSSCLSIACPNCHSTSRLYLLPSPGRLPQPLPPTSGDTPSSSDDDLKTTGFTPSPWVYPSRYSVCMNSVYCWTASVFLEEVSLYWCLNAVCRDKIMKCPISCLVWFGGVAGTVVLCTSRRSY